MMKQFTTIVSATLLSVFFAASAPAVEIKSISIEPATKAHLCRKIGGTDKDPTITIKHEPKAGDTITVRMYDVTSGGKTIEHQKKRVKSKASGTTVLTANFRAPCNTTKGRVNSSYRFSAKSKGSNTVTRGWFNYNSRTGAISR